MKDLKAHHHLAILSMLCFGIVGVWAWGDIVFASSSTQINVYVGPPDVCQNIDGYQQEVPAGMTVDADGNCATPPPPPVDLCDNIDGMQETLPDNYYRNSDGNCFPQPPQAKDVCPNLDGTQTSVPDGYVMIEDGRCIVPPKDSCDNIDGVQPLVPEGMVRTTNGVCFTPSPGGTGTGTGTGSSSAPGSTPLSPTDSQPLTPTAEVPTTDSNPSYSPQVDASSTRLKNIPDFLEAAVRPFVDAIPDSVKKTLRESSPIIARTFPYYVFMVLAAAAILLMVQTALEIAHVARLRKLLAREQAIAEEKDNFMSLASHYLRTPLTLMKNSLATVVSSGQIAPQAISQLQEAITALNDEIEVILHNISQNVTTHVKAPMTATAIKPTLLLSAFFWVPVATTIGITLFSNFLLGVVGNVELGTFNLLAQTAVLVTISGLFYSAMRTRYIKQQQLLQDQALVAHEEALDNARNEFINQALFTLHTKLSVIQGLRPVIEETQVATHFSEGIERFENMLKKFELLSQIQTGVLGASERFNIQDAVQTIISTHQADLEKRQLTIINNVKRTDIKQRRTLFDFVLGSLIENAIKFSNAGETIYIASSPHDGTLSLQVSDRGAALNDEKITHLFDTSMPAKPLEFNYEGLGFSLLLDKIIMDYVGGEISAQSSAQKNTTFNIETNAA